MAGSFFSDFSGSITYKVLGSAFGIASHVIIAVVGGGGDMGVESNERRMFGTNVSHLPILLGFPVASFLRVF